MWCAGANGTRTSIRRITTENGAGEWGTGICRESVGASMTLWGFGLSFQSFPALKPLTHSPCSGSLVAPPNARRAATTSTAGASINKHHSLPSNSLVSPACYSLPDHASEPPILIPRRRQVSHPFIGVWVPFGPVADLAGTANGRWWPCESKLSFSFPPWKSSKLGWIHGLLFRGAFKPRTWYWSCRRMSSSVAQHTLSLRTLFRWTGI